MLLDYCDVLIKPKFSTINSRADTVISRKFTYKHSMQVDTFVPIVAANMATVGTKSMAKVLNTFGMRVAYHKFIDLNTVTSVEDITKANNIYTVGQNSKEIEALVNQVSSSFRGYVMLDVANGYTQRFLDFCSLLRKTFPQATLIAGNIATAEMIPMLDKAGVDIIKVGIGPGQHCLTRSVTGVGVPQLAAIQDCSRVAHSRGLHIIADGGISEYGDIPKAFVAGADMVMIGSMFAGHTECEQKLVYENGKHYVECYGMASGKAQETHYDNQKSYVASEGRHTLIPYKGSVEFTVKEMLGGLRSAMTYTGSKTILDLKEAELIQVARTINKNLEKYQI